MTPQERDRIKQEDSPRAGCGHHEPAQCGTSRSRYVEADGVERNGRRQLRARDQFGDNRLPRWSVQGSAETEEESEGQKEMRRSQA